MVGAAIRTIFAQPTGAEVIEQVDKVAAMLQPKFPAVATMLNGNVQSARGALRKVVEDVDVSASTATAWPGWATVCCQGDVARSLDGGW
jgi:hypothetical protein